LRPSAREKFIAQTRRSTAQLTWSPAKEGQEGGQQSKGGLVPKLFLYTATSNNTTQHRNMRQIIAEHWYAYRSPQVTSGTHKLGPKEAVHHSGNNGVENWALLNTAKY